MDKPPTTNLIRDLFQIPDQRKRCTMKECSFTKLSRSLEDNIIKQIMPCANAGVDTVVVERMVKDEVDSLLAILMIYELVSFTRKHKDEDEL